MGGGLDVGVVVWRDGDIGFVDAVGVEMFGMRVSWMGMWVLRRGEVGTGKFGGLGGWIGLVWLV